MLLLLFWQNLAETFFGFSISKKSFEILLLEAIFWIHYFLKNPTIN
jgi:hypothetical protein